MATEWISPTWRMPENSNQSKLSNYSLSFDGSSNELIDLGTIFDDVFTGDSWTVSSWIYASANTSYDNFFNRGTSVQFYVESNKVKIWLGYPYLANINPLQSTLTLSLDTWYHIVFTRLGNENKLYINGSLDNSSTSTGSVASQPTSHLTIGSYGNTGNYLWEGKLTEYSIFDYALSVSQITALYNSGTPVNPMAISGQPPVAYYPLGGSSTGSASTLTIPNDSVSDATVFDFVSADGDRIIIEDTGMGTGAVNGINGAMTASIWVNTTAGLVYEYAFNRDQFGGTNRDWNLIKDNFYGSGGRMLFSVFNTSNVSLSVRLTGSTDPQGDPLITMNDGKWHHIVGVYNGTDTVELYTDGILQGTNTSAGHGAINATARTAIGGYNNSSNPSVGGGAWNGDLSNAQIWNTNISSAEVVTLYNNGVPLLTGTQPEAANLKAWYKLNVDTSAWDGTDWIISNSSANYPNSLQFNGTSSYIDTSSFTTSGDDVTISLWLNAINIAASSPSTTGALVYGDTNNFIYYNVNEIIYAKINGSTSYLIANSGGVPQIFGTGDWHHLAVVKSGSTVTWYVDGSPFSDLGTGGSGGFTMNYIGAAGGSSIYFLNGQLSNVAIFESALDASAVTTLYNSGQPETAISSSPLSWWKLDNLTTGIQDSGSASNNGTNNGATISGIAVSQENGISSSMTTANLVTSDLTRSIPYSSYSMEFDGVNDYIDLNNTSETTPASAYTISAWAMKTGAGTGSFPTIISSQKTAANGGGWTLAESTSTNKWRAYIDTTGSGGWVYAESDATITSSQWYHLVAHWDGSTITLYVDGVAQTTTAAAATISYGTITQNATIGTYVSNDFQGKISNCAIFSSALTQDQILTIYNGGVPNDISSLSPVGWWSLAGDSYYDGTDWICSDLGSGGNNGTSANMAGTELVGDGPGSTANGVATSMDIPANLKGDAPNSTSNAFSINMTEIDRVTSVPG